MPEEFHYYTAPQLSALLGVSDTTVVKWLWGAQARSRAAGRKLHLLDQALDRWTRKAA